MCEPASATMATIAVVSAAASIYGQQQQANNQAKYQSQMADANAKQMTENAQLANSAYVEQTKQLQIRNLQDGAAAQQQIIQNDTASLKAQATAKASASDSGVSGLSVDSLMADFQRQQANYDTTVRTNREWAGQQLTEDEKTAQAQANGRIASVQPYIAPPIKTPDYLGTAFGAAKDVYGYGYKAGPDGGWWK